MTTYSFGTNPSSINMTADYVYVVKGRKVSYTPLSNKDEWNQDCLGEVQSYNEESNYEDTYPVDEDKFTLLPGDTVILKWSVPYRTIYNLKQDKINVAVVGETSEGDNFICDSF